MKTKLSEIESAEGSSLPVLLQLVSSFAAKREKIPETSNEIPFPRMKEWFLDLAENATRRQTKQKSIAATGRTAHWLVSGQKPFQTSASFETRIIIFRPIGIFILFTTRMFSQKVFTQIIDRWTIVYSYIRSQSLAIVKLKSFVQFLSGSFDQNVEILRE